MVTFPRLSNVLEGTFPISIMIKAPEISPDVLDEGTFVRNGCDKGLR